MVKRCCCRCRGAGHPEGDEGEGRGVGRNSHYVGLPHVHRRGGEWRPWPRQSPAGHHLHPGPDQTHIQPLLSPNHCLPGQVTTSARPSPLLTWTGNSQKQEEKDQKKPKDVFEKKIRQKKSQKRRKKMTK